MFDPDYDVLWDIIQAGSISGAARGRSTSTAALSKRLSSLERRLGVQLIHRTTRRLVLTTAGKEFYDNLSTVRSSLASMVDKVTGRDLVMAGSLSLTAPTSFGRMHIVPALPAFMTRHPEVKLSIDLSDDFTDIMEGRHDLAIRIATQSDPGLPGRRLGSNRRVLCAAPSYLRDHGEPRDLKELAKHRILATRAQLPWRLNGPKGHVTYHGKSYVETTSSEAVRELALAGCGIALRSLWDVSSALLSGALCRVLGDHEGSHQAGIYAIHAPSSGVPLRISAMIQHLQDHFSAQASKTGNLAAW